MTRARFLRRRGFLRIFAAGALASGATAWGRTHNEAATLTVYTFGDSILDCGRYNEYGVHPAQLLVKNDDRLFPEFRGRDLSSHGPTRLVHRARDGATVGDLPHQTSDLSVEKPALALVTVGGNDLLQGLAADSGPGINAFVKTLDDFLRKLRVRQVLLGNVYDPTFGDDARNFLGIEARLARANLERMNREIARLAKRFGALADIHRHFLGGDPSWFTQTIEPSLVGASEVRRCLLQTLLSVR